MVVSCCSISPDYANGERVSACSAQVMAYPYKISRRNPRRSVVGPEMTYTSGRGGRNRKLWKTENCAQAATNGDGVVSDCHGREKQRGHSRRFYRRNLVRAIEHVHGLEVKDDEMHEVWPVAAAQHGERVPARAAAVKCQIGRGLTGSFCRMLLLHYGP